MPGKAPYESDSKDVCRVNISGCGSMGTVYYAQACRYSRDLCQQLFANQELAAKCRFVDAGRLPACRGMMVPTVVADNKKYVGKDAFAWVQNAGLSAPACYNIRDCAGIEFSEIGGLQSAGAGRSLQYCDISQSGGNAMTAVAAGPKAQQMDARVARLIRAREAAVPRACPRIG